MADELDELEVPPEWARPLRVRAAVTLPGLNYGDLVVVDRTDPTIKEYLAAGYLIPEEEA